MLFTLARATCQSPRKWAQALHLPGDTDAAGPGTAREERGTGLCSSQGGTGLPFLPMSSKKYFGLSFFVRASQTIEIPCGQESYLTCLNIPQVPRNAIPQISIVPDAMLDRGDSTVNK